MTQTLQLGMTLRDLVTGITGIATSKSENLSGSIQYSVQPKGDGTKVEETMYIDEQTLEVVDAGLSDRVTPADVSGIQLGWQVEDTVSGIRGIAVDRITFMNGCVRIGIQTRADKNATEPPKTVYIDHKSIKKIGQGVAPKEAPKAQLSTSAPVEEPARRTGGPNRSARALFGR